jgi:hypothetical protein
VSQFDVRLLRQEMILTDGLHAGNSEHCAKPRNTTRQTHFGCEQHGVDWRRREQLHVLALIVAYAALRKCNRHSIEHRQSKMSENNDNNIDDAREQ